MIRKSLLIAAGLLCLGSAPLFADVQYFTVSDEIMTPKADLLDDVLHFQMQLWNFNFADDSMRMQIVAPMPNFEWVRIADFTLQYPTAIPTGFYDYTGTVPVEALYDENGNRITTPRRLLVNVSWYGTYSPRQPGPYASVREFGSYDAEPIPEPSSMMLLATGALGLLGAGFRRMRRA